MKSIEDFRIELIILIGSFQQFQQSDWPIFLVYFKLGCVVRMVVDSILPHAESGPNEHRKDAPRFINSVKASIEQNITPGQERVRLETEIYNLNVAYGFGVCNLGKM